LAVVTTLPAFAAASCQVAVSTSPWTESPGVGGYTANLTVTNTGDPITAWTLNVTLPSGQGFTQGWSANWTASGTALTATNMSWNGSLATGGSTQIGYNGRWSGSFVAPSVFKLNGTTCNGSPEHDHATTHHSADDDHSAVHDQLPGPRGQPVRRRDRVRQPGVGGQGQQ
jgi:hypothetical protein